MSRKFRFRMSSLILILLLFFGLAESKFKIQIKMLVSSDTLDPKDFKPGVSIEPQPDSVFYNKYIPLIFQLKVPDFSPDSIRLNSSIHCMTDSLTPNYLCPVAYHFERLLIPLADNMKFSKNIYSPMEGSQYFGEIRCNLIETHFQHISANINELHVYTDKLMSECALAKNITIIQKNMTSGTANHISIAEEKIMTTFAENNSSLSDEYKLAQMAGYVGLQASYILTKYIDTIRWANGFTSCQSNKLNINLIHSYLLQTSLYQVKSIAETNGFKLSIDTHEHLPHYYKLPLTDCILGVQNSKKSTLMLRIAVPVMKKDTKYTRIKITKIPYLVAEPDGSNKQICEIDNFEPTEEFLLQDNENNSSQQIITNIADCFDAELCYVPETPRRPLVDPCLKGLINGSVDDIRDYCSFSCYEVEHADNVFPIIIKIDSNHYSITGSPPSSENIQLYCDNIYKENINPNGTNGVLQVILPCNCELRFRSNVYKAYKPCESPLAIHYLSTIPFHAIYLDEDTFNLLGATSHNLSKIIEANETGTTIKTSSTEESDIAYQEDVDGPIAAKSSSHDHGHSHDHTSSSSCKSHSTQLGFIWLFIILLLLSNLILLYVVYCNRLLQMDLISGWFSGWGFTSSPPVTRLREDPVVMSQQQSHNDNFSQPAWPTPASLNRL